MSEDPFLISESGNRSGDIIMGGGSSNTVVVAVSLLFVVMAFLVFLFYVS